MSNDEELHAASLRLGYALTRITRLKNDLKLAEAELHAADVAYTEMFDALELT